MRPTAEISTVPVYLPLDEHGTTMCLLLALSDEGKSRSVFLEPEFSGLELTKSNSNFL